jgi:acetyl-CoA synthetase
MKERGVQKGDRVTIYMPMVPEAAYAMLACARIGAIHSVVFGGFSPDSLGGRILDCESTVVITADEGVRGGRKIPLSPAPACTRSWW